MRPLLSVIALSLLPFLCKGFSSPAPNGKPKVSSIKDFDFESNDKLPWVESGYETWKWGDYDINYVEMGDPTKPALVLIHGFGASSYHWRYNIPVLARDYHVFAFCKLGLGLSSKALEEYSADLWRDQTLAFLNDVVQKPATLAGNSIGGFTSLYTAATEEAKSMVNGVVLLNAAGRFRDSLPDTEPEETNENPFFQSLQQNLLRFVIGVSFIFTKQPLRIEQVLKQVYTNHDYVDQELVESIRYPAQDPNAAEVFYRIVSRNTSGRPKVFFDDLLEKIDCPLLLCHGMNDPWIVPVFADKIQAKYPKCERVNLNAGHCPQDDAPDAVNKAISTFMEKNVVSA